MSNIQIRSYQTALGTGLKAMPFPKPTVLSGSGSVYRIPDILAQEDVKKPLIVTGPRVSREAFFDKLIEQIPDCTVYDEVQTDPPISMIEELVTIYNDNFCDGLIAIGGGSNMDAAKACAARIARPDKDLISLGGTMKVLRRTPLLIAVPTTAGTGSECTIAAVVTDTDNAHKYAINDPAICPSYAVLDPDLTLSVPQDLTAYTGMDALTHAIEAYLNSPYHKRDTKKLCEDAILAILKYLPIAYSEPDNLQAREQLLQASFKAGSAFTVACVGNVHAAAHTIGARYHIQHGLANAVLLPIVLVDYGDTVTKELAKLARKAKLAKGNDVVCAEMFIERIQKMNYDMRIPAYFDMIKAEDIPQMAVYAEAEANPLYPVPVIYDTQHFEYILRRAGRI